MKLFALLIFLPSFAFAGNGWIGSGGEVFKDAHNPWFVKNTKTVRYCVSVSAASISISEADVKIAVSEALEHWNKEVARASSKGEDGQFAMGDWKFQEEACPADMLKPDSDPNSASSAGWPDIRFLFGYETLGKKELEFLRDPKKYIGVSVRTSYDEVNLQAKGFVYMASDFGANAYENAGTLISKAWSHPILLKYALLHEVGHVFGLPHTGTGLMSEAFLDQMLNKGLSEKFEALPIPSFFEPAAEVEMCDFVGNASRQFFKLTMNQRCVVLKQTSEFKWEVFAKDDKDSATKVKLGDLIAQPPDLMDWQPKPSIFLQITSQQKVYSSKETAFRTFMIGPLLKEWGSKANFVAGPGDVRTGYVRITPSSLLLTGNVNGKIELVLSYSSPLGLLLTLSPSP